MTLREARLGRGFTQEQLAARVGVDQTTISDLERGRNRNPSWETVGRIAIELGVQASELFPLSTDEADGQTVAP